MKNLCPNSIPFKKFVLYFIELVFSVILILSSANTAFSQYICQAPQPTGPGYWQSVDPPTITWSPVSNPPWCIGAVVEYGYLPYYCDVNQLTDWFVPQDVVYTVPNSLWNIIPLDEPHCWAMRSGTFAMNHNIGGTLVRLPAALSPVSIILPVYGATGISLTPLLKWTTVADAINYRVTVYHTKWLNTVALDTLTPFDSIYVPSGEFTENTNYLWRVKPYSATGEGPYCDLSTFTTGFIPAAPLLVSPVDNASEVSISPTLVWNTSLSASTYRLQVARDAGFNNIIFNDSTLTSTSEVIPGLAYLTSYFWRVNAKNSFGTGPWSSVWKFTTTDGLPSQVVLSSPANNSVELPVNLIFNWYRASEVTSYLQKEAESPGVIAVKYNTDAIDAYCFELTTDTITFAGLTRDTTLTDTTKAISGLSLGAKYYWRVKAKNSIGWGKFSLWWYFATTDGLPKQVILYSPENNAIDLPPAVTFTWYQAFEINPNKLRIDEKKDNKKNTKAISAYCFELTSDTVTLSGMLRDTTVMDTTKDVSGLLASTSYYWRVKAKNETGWGSYSLWWKLTTMALPAVPVLYLPENLAANVSIIPEFDWGDADGAVNYSIQVSTNPDFSAPVLDSGEIAGSGFLSPCGILKYDTLYYWRVKSNNVIGSSSWSEIWNFTVYSKPEWFIQCTGVQNTLLDLVFINANTGWACGYDGVIKTTNGGSLWFPVNNGIDLACLSIFFIDENTGWVANDFDLIYKTTNGGNSWNYGIEEGAYGNKSFDFINANTGFFAIYNWAKNSGEFSRSNTADGYDHGIFKTTDGGIDWFSIDVPLTTNYNAVDFPGSGTIGYTCGGSGDEGGTGYMLKTTDEGVIWTEMDVTGSAHLTDLSFIDQLTGWAVGSGSTVIYTSNGGMNWTLRNSSIEDDLVSVYFINENTGWTCGGNNIYNTTDAGMTWTLAQNIFPGLTSITFKNSKGWISGENGLILKNDGVQETPVPILISPLNGSVGVSLAPLLDWSDVTGASEYRAQVSTDSNFSSTIIDAGNLTISQFLIPSGILSDNTIYYWRVKARGISGWGNYTGWWSFTTITPSPASPILAAPINNSIGIILPVTLIWNPVPTAVNYKLQLSEDSSFGTFIINDSTQADTSELITALDPLTNYYWRVAAGNPGGWSAFSQIWEFRTLGYPSQVSLFSPANNSINMPTSITFIWNHAVDLQSKYKPKSDQFKNESKESDLNTLSKHKSDRSFTDEYETIGYYWFELSADTVSLSGLIRDSTLADTSKTINGFSNSASYYWRVKAKNETGWGQFSSWWKFTTIVSAPAAPVLSFPSDNSTGNALNIILLWNRSAGASSYRVQLALDSNFSSLILNDSNVTDSMKAVTGLGPLVYYYWKVNAKNIGGTSDYSQVWRFKTIGEPNQVILVAPVNNAVNQPVDLTFIWRRAFDQTSVSYIQPFVYKNERAPLKNSVQSTIESSVIDMVNNYYFELTTDTVTYANVIRDSLLLDTVRSVNGLIYNTSYFWRVKAKNEIGWGSFSDWFRFTTQTMLNLNVAYSSDWNMLSIPVNADPNGVQSVFPACTPPAFYYDNGYQSDTILIPGKGYWLYFASGGTQNITGLAISPKLIPVIQNWNMIGAFENDVPVSSITSNPPGIINSGFFEYSGGYTAVDTLIPGTAYWVNVTQSGNLIIPYSIDRLNESIVFNSEQKNHEFTGDWVELNISDNSAKSTDLFLANKEEMNSSYLLPPVPPMGIFDARFGSDCYAEMLGLGRHVINIKTGDYPIKIKVKNLKNLKLQLKDNINGKLLDMLLIDNSEISISDPINSFVLFEQELPTVFSLSQNYPNPFNPLTHIKYAVPRKVHVKMVLYDILGREVMILVNEIKEAGYYLLDLKADEISSGVYFYRIEAGNFIDVKKLIIIK